MKLLNTNHKEVQAWKILGIPKVVIKAISDLIEFSA